MFVLWVIVYNCVFSRLEFALQVHCKLYQIIFVAPSQAYSSLHMLPYNLSIPTFASTQTSIYSAIPSRRLNSPAVYILLMSSHLSSLVQFFLATAAIHAFVLPSYSN